MAVRCRAVGLSALAVIVLVALGMAAFNVVHFYAGEEVVLRQSVVAPPSATPSHTPTATPSVEPSTPAAQPTPTPTQTPSPVSIPGSPPTALQWARPGVGVIADFPVGSPMQTSPDGVIKPDGHALVRWVNDPDMGAPGSNTDRTVYMAGHTSPIDPAVFNPLYDRATSTSHVQIGDEFLVTTEATVSMGLPPLRYVVDGVQDFPKGVVATDKTVEVWHVVPGRLVILTCFQNPAGVRSTSNFVVFTHLVP